MGYIFSKENGVKHLKTTLTSNPMHKTLTKFNTYQENHIY